MQATEIMGYLSPNRRKRPK